MRFLAVSPAAAAALLLGVAALVLILYLLRPRARRVVVASTLIWRTLSAAQKRATDRWRWLLSLALAMAIALGMALALTRPELPALGGLSKRVVLVLDNSASMAARGARGASRWETAVRLARERIEAASAGSEFAVMDTLGYAAGNGFTGRAAAVAAIAKLAPILVGSARMPLIPVANDSPPEIYLYTDGVTPLDAEKQVHIESVFESADNAAVIGFEARALPNDPTRYQGFARVFNASSSPKSVQLEITGAGGFALRRDIDLPAGEASNQTFDVSDFSGGVLQARVRLAGDGFAFDDIAYAVVAPHRGKRVLLVTPGNPYLEETLRILPGVQTTIQQPAGYRAADQFDAYVFDRFAPPQAPASGVLLFRPPLTTWLSGAFDEVKQPAITRWDAEHPLTAALSWRDVHVKRAALARVDAAHSGVVFARGAQEGVLVAAGGVERRWIRIGFAIEDSNVHLQAGFPVFLGHALDWLAPRPEALIHGIGTIAIARAGTTVTDREGRSVETIRINAGAVFEARAPNVFTLQDGRERSQIVANMLDSRVSAINRSRLAAYSPQAPATTPAKQRWHVELWALLLLLAAGLLILEWFTFCRRITV